MHSQLHWLHLEKRICESSAFLQKCIYSYIGCFCKKNSQCQWSLASQENRIGFVGFGVCFDLLGPKFSFRARRLKKGAGRVLPRQHHPSLRQLPDHPRRQWAAAFLHFAEHLDHLLADLHLSLLCWPAQIAPLQRASSSSTSVEQT